MAVVGWALEALMGLAVVALIGPVVGLKAPLLVSWLNHEPSGRAGQSHPVWRQAFAPSLAGHVDDLRAPVVP